MASAPPRPDPEEQHRRQEQLTHSQAATNAANQQAQQTTFDLEQIVGQGIIDDIRDPDMSDEELVEALDAEMSGHVAISNITREEYAEEKTMDRARHCLSTLEKTSVGGVGFKTNEVDPITGQRWRTIITGGVVDDPVMVDTDREARQRREAYDDRTLARSLGVEGKALDKIFDAVAVSKTETDEGDGSGGFLDRFLG